MASANRVWLITGASSGFGRHMTETALERGDSVVAALRKPEILSELAERYPERLLLQSVDVTSKEQVATAFVAARDRFGRIDVVFNNAGISHPGEIEGTPENTARYMFEVNYWGNVHVTLKALEYFRMNSPSGGRLLQMSSSFGVEGVLGAGHYSATKTALEGFSIALIGELDPAWNIKITLLEPGPFQTDGIDHLPSTLTPQHPAYINPNTPVYALRKTIEEGRFVADGDAKKAIEAFYRVSLLEDPPQRLPLHRDAVEATRRKAKELERIVYEYASWSAGVYVDA